jgi:hypothetical protein
MTVSQMAVLEPRALSHEPEPRADNRELPTAPAHCPCPLLLPTTFSKLKYES